MQKVTTKVTQGQTDRDNPNSLGGLQKLKDSVLRRLCFYDFEVFLAVAQTGSFRKAGIVLQTSQSAVSRRIQKMEDGIGVSFFERHANGARLTSAGWRFLICARTIVRDARLAIDAARFAGTARVGELNVGICASLAAGMLKELVGAYVLTHSDVAFSLTESPHDELLTLLAQRKLDAVVALGIFADEQGDQIIIENQRIYVALPIGHRLAEQGKIHWAELADETFLVGRTGLESSLYEQIIVSFGSSDVRPGILKHDIGREALMGLVGLGLGVSLATGQWSETQFPDVIFRPIANQNASIPLSLIWRPENDNPALRRFVSLARVHADGGT